MGERGKSRSGSEFMRAVALGYDLCCRWLLALGPNHVRATHRSAEGVSATIGAAAAAASMAGSTRQGMRYALSYAVQQVSGVWSWERDVEHVEKAFDFAGMGARNGVTAALMVQARFHRRARRARRRAQRARGALARAAARGDGARSRQRGSSSRETAIKTFSVGYPIQAALDAFLSLRREHGAHRRHVDRIVATLPEDGARHRGQPRRCPT